LRLGGLVELGEGMVSLQEAQAAGHLNPKVGKSHLTAIPPSFTL
jgi:hypothetical protein